MWSDSKLLQSKGALTAQPFVDALRNDILTYNLVE